MRPEDKISKSTWSLFEAAKDSVTANVTTAVRDGRLKVEAAQLPTLLALLGASLDEGYHKGHRVFNKSVEQALAEASAAAVASNQVTKKKKA